MFLPFFFHRVGQRIEPLGIHISSRSST